MAATVTGSLKGMAAVTVGLRTTGHNAGLRQRDAKLDGVDGADERYVGDER